MVSFIVGGLVPLLAMVLSPRAIEIWVAGAAVLIASMLTGYISAKLGRIPVLPSIVRNVAGGLLAMGITYGLGALVGTQL
jgi:VIT1/CCC1 family predicted Fe2+/Mn2+ transporter